MSVANQEAGVLTWRVRIMFAVGQIPEGVQSTSFGFFLLFFYNQVLGLSGFLASVAIVIALLVDAISDPVIGSWSDGFRHRWGRRHPRRPRGCPSPKCLFGWWCFRYSRERPSQCIPSRTPRSQRSSQRTIRNALSCRPCGPFCNRWAC